jgi:hypothetical protein
MEWFVIGVAVTAGMILGAIIMVILLDRHGIR